MVKGTGLHVRGLHMHTGSEIKDVGVFLRALEILFDAAGRFPELDFLDLGSGFKVPYKPGDPETDVAALGRAGGGGLQRRSSRNTAGRWSAGLSRASTW